MISRKTIKMKKTIRMFGLMFCTILMCVGFTACGDDDDGGSAANIVGSWYGTRTYYNPVGGTKYQYLSITFESNGTGSMEYEAPGSFSVAKFTYRVQGNTIVCVGAYANTYGDSASDFTMKIAIEGDRLVPIDKYSNFILTRDGSVMTDGDGNEVIDQSNLLQNVWKENLGGTVLVINSSTYTEYVLTSSFSNTYSYYNEGTVFYDASRKIINFNGIQFKLKLLTETTLSIQRESDGYVLNYTRGNLSDIPNRKK